MEDAITKKFVNRMHDLKLYLETLLVSKFPIEHIREGLQFALEPVGIHVEVSSNPLLIPDVEGNPYGYANNSPAKPKRRRDGGGTRRAPRTRMQGGKCPSCP
jgi:hypothetical protein